MNRRGLEHSARSGDIVVVWPDPRPTGQDLYAFREKMGWTQHQTALYFGKSRTTVQKYEAAGSGLVLPDASMAREIDAYLRRK